MMLLNIKKYIDRKDVLISGTSLPGKNKFFLVTLCLIIPQLFLVHSVLGQPKVENFNSLSMQQATSIGLQNNPTLRVAASNYDVSVAGLRLSRSSYFPNINFSASGVHNEGTSIISPQIPPQSRIYSNYSAGFSGSQLLYDFGRTTNRVESSKNLVEASSYDLQAAQENVVVNIQTAYYSLLQAQYVEKVNEDQLKQTEEHLKIAQAFYQAGTRPQYDVTKAQVDVANAKVNLLRSQNQIQIAKLQLENAMGIQNPGNYVITDSLQVQPFSVNLEEAKNTAFNNRSELKALNYRLQANQDLVSSVWSQNLPSISATGNYLWNGFEYTNLPTRWNAGITLSLPIFQGFAVNAQVQQNEALVEQTRANVKTTRQAVLLDVSQNFWALNEALNRISASKVLIQSAEENLKLAMGRYNSGVGSATEITDAQVTLANARIINIQALYDYNSDLIKLKKSMGIIIAAQ